MDCESRNNSPTTTCDSTTTVTTKFPVNVSTIIPTTNSSDTDVSERAGQPSSTISRVKLKEKNFKYFDRKELWSKWRKQDDYIDLLEAGIDSNSSNKSDTNTIEELEEKLKQQKSDASKRENELTMRLAKKEQKIVDLKNRIKAMREALVPSDSRLNSTLLDPALNAMFERMKSEVVSSRERLDQAQNELAAWKFTTDSHTGKQLMAKCQALYKENEELGKTIESGRIGKLEAELALQKSFVEEMKKSQLEADEFLFELDEDIEGLQSTMLHLRNQSQEGRK